MNQQLPAGNDYVVVREVDGQYIEEVFHIMTDDEIEDKYFNEKYEGDDPKIHFSNDYYRATQAHKAKMQWESKDTPMKDELCMFCQKTRCDCKSEKLAWRPESINNQRIVRDFSGDRGCNCTFTLVPLQPFESVVDNMITGVMMVAPIMGPLGGAALTVAAAAATQRASNKLEKLAEQADANTAEIKKFIDTAGYVNRTAAVNAVGTIAQNHTLAAVNATGAMLGTTTDQVMKTIEQKQNQIIGLLTHPPVKKEKKVKFDVPPKRESAEPAASARPLSRSQKWRLRQQGKMEALVTNSVQFIYTAILQAFGEVVDSTGSRLTWCISTNVGVFWNTHAMAQGASHFRFNGKIFEMTKKRNYNHENSDLTLSYPLDGPYRLEKKYFDHNMVEGQQLALVWPGGHVDGKIEGFDTGPMGPQVRMTHSTKQGDCGAVYVNANGKIVAFHFSAGKKDVNNLAIPVTAGLVQLFSAAQNF